MFILLGISVSLAALLTFNSLASLGTATLWRVAHRCTRPWSAAARARVLYLLRVLPATLGIACVLFLLAPAYLELEPRTTAERVSLKLAIIAFASAVGMTLAIIRAAAAWRATARLSADWLAHGEPISISRVAVPAYRIEHQFPVIAIVGVLRPRLFLGSQVFGSLTPAELSAAVEHEAGHLVAHDNVKRGLLRACRDATLILPCGRALDRAWAEASESAADEHAARKGRTVALDLASALVKVSRMIPAGAKPAMPAGAFLIGEESSGVKTRVRRLIQLASSEGRTAVYEPLVTKLAVWLCFALVFSVLAIIQSNPNVLAAIHDLIERVVAFLT
jgi:Zn-dependent protease with chaperone function